MLKVRGIEMQFNKSNALILLICLVVSLISIGILSQPDTVLPLVPTQTAINETLFPPFDVQAVTELRLVQGGLDSRFIRAANGEWFLNGDPEQALDGFTIESVLSILGELRYQDHFDSVALASFGLDQPARIEIHLDDESVYSLLIGNKNPGETHYYLLDQAGQIGLSEGTFELENILNYAAEPPTEAIAMTLPPPDLQLPGLVWPGLVEINLMRLEMNHLASGHTLAMGRDENDSWRVDIANAVDEIQATDPLLAGLILSVLSNLEASHQVNVKDLASVGLAEPAYQIQAVDRQGGYYTLAIGDKDASGTLYYVKRNDYEPILLLSAEKVDLLTAFIERPPFLNAD